MLTRGESLRKSGQTVDSSLRKGSVRFSRFWGLHQIWKTVPSQDSGLLACDRFRLWDALLPPSFPMPFAPCHDTELRQRTFMPPSFPYSPVLEPLPPPPPRRLSPLDP